MKAKYILISFYLLIGTVLLLAEMTQFETYQFVAVKTIGGLAVYVGYELFKLTPLRDD